MPYQDYSTALVTGASTGMGRALAVLLAEHGLTVHALARDEARLAELAASHNVIPHAVDLRSLDSITETVGDLPIDVLINCAGVSAPGNVLSDEGPDAVDAMVDVNLRAVLHLSRLLVPGMVERDCGHIVNISSIAGIHNFFGHTAYHATKAAVHQVSRQLRNDTMGRRIRVTEVCPGRVETEIFGRNMGGSPEDMKLAWETYYEGFESLTTDDIVSCVDFAIGSPRHMNVSMLEVLPTFQVAGGLTFDRREG